MDVFQSGESIMVEVAAGPINSSTQEKVFDYFKEEFYTFPKISSYILSSILLSLFFLLSKYV